MTLQVRIPTIKIPTRAENRKGDGGKMPATYAVLRYLTDPTRDITVPVAVAIAHWWEPDEVDEGKTIERHLWWRTPEPKERIKGANTRLMLPQLQLATSQINCWFQEGELPHQQGKPEVGTVAWWEHIRKLCQWSIRIGTIGVIDYNGVGERGIETLYRQVVQPRHWWGTKL